MVNTVDGNPSRGRVFEAADTQYCEGMLDPSRSFEASVGQQPVVADRDSLSENVDTNKHGKESNPRKKVGDQGHEAE